MTVNVVVSKAPVARPIIETVDAGVTLREILESHSGLSESHCRIQVNGVVGSDWDAVTKDGDNIVITQMPTGFGPITWIAIASIALSVATFFLFSPDEPDIPEDEKKRRVEGDRNQNKAYEPVPFVLGRRKLTPAYMANPYFEYVGKDQYYRMLLDCGYGPMNITDVRIGEVPITSFSDVQFAVLDWYNTTSVEPLKEIWARDVVQNRVSEELPRLDEFRNSFIPVGRGLTRVTVAYPNGLYWIKGSGSKDDLNGSVEVQYQGGDGSWYTPVYYRVQSGQINGVGPYEILKAGGVLYRGGSLYQDWGGGKRNLIGAAEPVPTQYIAYDDGNGFAVIKAPSSYYVANIRAWAKTTKLFTKSIQFDQNLVGSPLTNESVPIRARNLSPGNSSKKPWIDTATLLEVTRDAVLTDARFDELIGSPSGQKRRAIIALRIKATDQVSGTLDTVNCTAESVVPSTWANDWRDWFGQTLTPTRNPADLYRWVLQGPFNNAKVGNEKINLGALNAWRSDNVADGWETSDLVNYQTGLKKLLNNVAKSGRAEFTLRDGRFSVSQMKEQPGPVQIFTPKNSWGFQSKRDFPPPSDGIKVEFQNENEDYELDEWTFFDPDIPPANRVGKTDNIELWGVTKPELAQKHARFAYLETRLRREIYELNTDIENLACARGDEVWIQNDIIDVGIGSGRVLSVGSGVFEIDEEIGLVAGNSYGVVVRNVSNGTQFRQITATYNGNRQWSTASAIEFESGDLASYGEAGQEVLECIVTNVKPERDVGAIVTMVNAANEIFTFDGGPLPVFETNLTPRPENQPPAVPVVQVGLGSTKYGEPTAIVTVSSDERIASKAVRYRLQYRIVTEIQEDIETGEIVPEADRVQLVEDAVWIDAPDVDARVGSAEVPIPLEAGNVVYFRAKAAGSANLMSAWSPEVSLTVSEQPAPDVNGFTITEQVNTPKTPDGMFSTLVITVDEPDPDPYLFSIAEYRLPGQDEWLFISRIGWKFASEAEVQVLANGTQYEFRVRSVSVWGVENFYGIRQTFTTTNVIDPGYDDQGPDSVLPVPDVSGLELFGQGNDTEFTGRDAKFVWRKSTVGDWVELGFEGLRGASAGRLDQYFRDYKVEIWAEGKIVRAEEVLDPIYVYTFEKNAEDYNREKGASGAWREFQIRVIERGRNNQQSERPAILDVSNTAPAPIAALSVLPGFSVIEISYLRPDDLDFAGVDIWVSTVQGFDPDTTEPTATVSDNSYVVGGLADDTAYYVRVRPFDLFGRTGTNTSAEFAVTTKTGQDLSGLSGWAYEVDPADRAFIEANLAADAVPSEKIVSLTAAKLITGTLQATETITSEGLIRSVDDINNPQIQSGIGPLTIDGTTYLLWGYNAGAAVGDKLRFGIDELGNATFNGGGSFSGTVSIGAGSSGVANLSDAGALATKSSVDLATAEVVNKTADNITESGTRKWAGESGADVTANNTAANIVNQGTLATLSAVGNDEITFNYATSVSKGGNAVDTDNVSGTSAATVKDGAVKANAGLDASGSVTQVIQGSKLPTGVSNATGGELLATNQYLGWHNGNGLASGWMTYIKSDGQFHFGDADTGAATDNFIDYNGSTLAIKTDSLIIDTGQFSLDAAGNATFGGELVAASGVFGDEATGEFIRFQGGIFEVGPNASIGSNANRTVTVGSGGDFATLNLALESLSRTVPAYKSGGFTADIILLDGYNIESQVHMFAIDLSWVRIYQQNGNPVTAHLQFSRTDLFVLESGSKLPLIDFEISQVSNVTGQIFNLMGGSSAEVYFSGAAGTEKTFTIGTGSDLVRLSGNSEFRANRLRVDGGRSSVINSSGSYISMTGGIIRNPSSDAFGAVLSQGSFGQLNDFTFENFSGGGATCLSVSSSARCDARGSSVVGGNPGRGAEVGSSFCDLASADYSSSASRGLTILSGGSVVATNANFRLGASDSSADIYFEGPGTVYGSGSAGGSNVTPNTITSAGILLR